MKKYLILSLLIITGCKGTAPTQLGSNSSEWHFGENLITPYSELYSDWVHHVKPGKNEHSKMWQHPEKGFSDSYVVTVKKGYQIDLKDYRNIQDAPGHSRCKPFTSVVLKTPRINSFDSLLWVTNCKTSNKYQASIVHMAIQGKDSFYHIQKIWKYKVDGKEMKKWWDEISKTYVCDTRDPKKLCPSGFKKVKDI